MQHLQYGICFLSKVTIARLLLLKGTLRHQARRNVFVSGGYKFVRTLYNLVVKVVCLKFWHKPHLWLGGTSPEPPCFHSSDATVRHIIFPSPSLRPALPFSPSNCLHLRFALQLTMWALQMILLYCIVLYLLIVSLADRLPVRRYFCFTFMIYKKIIIR